MSFLRPRVKAIVELAQALLMNVGIDLSGRNVGVAEHHLNRAKICAVLQKMGREAMPQHVGRNLANADSLAVSAEDLPLRVTSPP